MSEDYREARAEAAAASSRARALRPWYRKKRYVIGLPLLGLMLVMFIGGLANQRVGGDESTTIEPAEAVTTADAGAATEAATALAPTEAPAANPAIGDTVEVGSLDLTVVGVLAVEATQYAPFNEANVAVRIRATNARGEEGQLYNIAPLAAFRLVDAAGVAHQPVAVCANCPAHLTNTDLTRGGTIEAVLYFALPPDPALVELRYAPVFSTNRATIRLR
ncbi:MAG: DUF4352 domain-containing protein [Dehalococcoidia bacterium]